ncbi:DUF7511 domain-containing protein [Halovivax gelatinilyticus]|uniref:DUF7511 domain-containing protein n=1 Tax=Halovivax gelatinilyticus TaxID=2961597 RepID=UPI0020CA525F|nr:hypothetical protein [Halovivax gelatinilyticus]
MSVHDGSVGRSVAQRDELELLTDDERVWTAVPVDAEGEQRLTQWLSVEADLLCELDEWR